MSSHYERELKGIFEGDQVLLEKITKRCTPQEKDNFYAVIKKRFIVVRAAGSLGVDLVALRGDVSFLVEIKSSVQDTLHFSSVGGKLQQQALAMQQDCVTTKTLPIYAFRLKNAPTGDSWRLFTMQVPGLEGRLQVLSKRLPLLQQSKQGSYIMRWHEGLPLSDFIAYLCK